MIELPAWAADGWRGREKELELLFTNTYPLLVQEVERYNSVPGDVDDLAIDSFWRIARGALKEGAIDPTPSYIRTAVKWVVVDHIRALEREQRDLEYALRGTDFSASFDTVGDLLRSRTAVEIVDRAMDRARRRGDRTTFQVASLLLDLMETEGAMPSDRRIAKELGISHVAVGKARLRLRSLLEEEREIIRPSK